MRSVYYNLKILFICLLSFVVTCVFSPASASSSGPGSPPAFPDSPPPTIQKVSIDLPDLAPSLESSVTTTIKLNPGWNIISFTVKSLEKTSGFTHVIYKYSDGRFLPFDPINRPKEIKPGTGYLVWSDKGGDVEITGTPNNEKSRSVNLEPGWNLLGFSRTREFGSNRMTVSLSGESKSFQDAMKADEEGNVWVSPVIFNALAPNMPINLLNQKGSEPSGRGFWVFSYRNLNLTIVIRNDNAAANTGDPGTGMPSIPQSHPGFENPADVARGTDVAPPPASFPDAKSDNILTTGTLGGKVEDNDHKPIANARVALDNGMVVYTDARGVYIIKDVPEGPYSITVSQTGYRTATGKVNITAGQVSKILISLSGVTDKAIKGGNAPVPQTVPKSVSYSQPELQTEPKEEPPKTGKLRVVVRAYSNGYHRWWPRKVEVYESGNSSKSWSKTWDHDTGDSSYEIYCDRVNVGKTYVIKVDWRSRNRGRPTSGTWERKVYSTDQTESIDSLY